MNFKGNRDEVDIRKSGFIENGMKVTDVCVERMRNTGT